MTIYSGQTSSVYCLTNYLLQRTQHQTFLCGWISTPSSCCSFKKKDQSSLPLCTVLCKMPAQGMFCAHPQVGDISQLTSIEGLSANPTFVLPPLFTVVPILAKTVSSLVFCPLSYQPTKWMSNFVTRSRTSTRRITMIFPHFVLYHACRSFMRQSTNLKRGSRPVTVPPTLCVCQKKRNGLIPSFSAAQNAAKVSMLDVVITFLPRSMLCSGRLAFYVLTSMDESSAHPK
jgi:hypothetical protein